MILASALFSAGQETDADRIIGNIKDMIERTKAYYLNSNLKAYLFRNRLADGDKNAAEEWLKEQDGSLYENLTFYKIYRHFTTARAYIVTGNYVNATLLLQKLLKLNERYKRPLDIMEAQILLAIAYWKKGRSGINIALDYLEKAVIMAFEYGYTQLFANEGAELVNMLHRMQKRSVQQKYAGDLPGGFVKTLYITAVAGSKRFKGLTGGRAPDNLTFTDKQKTVMSLMCEGCSRNEIAERMGLKPNGVVSHTTLIYRKLDVSNSVEAILKIKELGIL